MNRIFRGAGLLAGIALAAGLAHAQPRPIPERARLGTLEIVVFPQARLDDKPVTMSPGARIFGTTNTTVTPMSVTGPREVLYRLDPMGQISEAWLLTAEELRIAREAARRPPGANAPQTPQAPPRATPQAPATPSAPANPTAPTATPRPPSATTTAPTQ